MTEEIAGNIHAKVALPDRSYAGIVKKTIREFAKGVGFTGQRLGEIELIVSELLSNAVKYAHEKCHLLYKKIERDNVPGIEIIYLDDGPGMKNPQAMLKNGTSTTPGSLGQGLGAVFRQSDFFDLYSQEGKGTVILCHKFLSHQTGVVLFPEITVGTVAVPMPGETQCGDGWHCVQHDKSYNIAVTDGLGHGKNASIASEAAMDTFKNNQRLSPHEHLSEMHGALRKTRGAVCMICALDYPDNSLNFCGIGNIAAKLISSHQVVNCTSYNGVVGYTMPGTFHDKKIEWPDRSLLVVHSDGINTRWNLTDYPGIEEHHPSLIAAVLYKNHNRGRDDSLVLVVKRQRRQAYPYSFMYEHQ